MALRNGTNLRYVHLDHLGSTSVVTNTSGTEYGRIRYYPYGSTRGSSGSLDTDKKFTGQRLDSTGLYYYNARYYDPTIGRFISADTIVPNPANPQSFNRYSYCFNNPLRYTDPTGHDPPWEHVKRWVKKYIGDDPLDVLQTGLDVVGFIPGVGELADAANGGIYWLRGDELNAGLSWGGCMPFLGWGATIGKWYNKAHKVTRLIDTGQDIGGFLRKAGKSEERIAKVTGAFNPGAKVVKLEDNAVVYRYSGGTTPGSGDWYTPELLSDPVNQLSLPPGATAGQVDRYIIPAGTEVVYGTAAAKEAWGTTGGAVQIFITDPSKLIKVE